MKQSGFIPLIPLLIIAAFVSITGIAAVKSQTVSRLAPNLLQMLTQTTTKSVNGLITYTTEGTAKASTILVKFKSNIPDQTISSIHQQLGTKVKKTVKDINVQVVELPDNGHVADFVKKFKNRAEVAYAEPNFLTQAFFTPNDPDFSSQWNLQKINASVAWDSSQGGFGPIAVIDTGVDASHSDLTGEVENGYNFISDNTDTSDDNGHGTHVAGIIEAATNNGNGIASIGFKGTLLPIKVLDSTGSGTDGDVASGITYATDNGAKIINLSLGGSDFSQTEQDAVNYAIKHGVIVVAAAGNNSNNSPVYPAADSGVLAVSASNQNDNLASFSSFGSDIYVSAPGVSITSTYNNGGYAQMSGTSMAAPHLAGLLGLAYSLKNSSGINIIDAIKQTSDKVGPYSYDQNGWNQYFGYGRLNAGKLLTLLSGIQNPLPSPSSTPLSPNQAGAAAPHAANVFSFNVDLEGIIDSIDLGKSKLTIRVSGISQNVPVSSGNLIDLFVNFNTNITLNNQPLSINSLSVEQKINAKALWQDNKLTASNITVQGTTTQNNTTPSNSQNNNSNSNSSPNNLPQNIPQNGAANSTKTHPGKPF